MLNFGFNINRYRIASSFKLVNYSILSEDISIEAIISDGLPSFADDKYEDEDEDANDTNDVLPSFVDGINDTGLIDLK